MLECYQCGCKEELAVGLIWEDQKAQVVCLACEGMYELLEEDYVRYTVLIEAAKQRAATRYQTNAHQVRNLTTGETAEIEEEDLPF